MNNKGFDDAFDEKGGKSGVDIAGEVKVRPKNKSKYRPKWSSVLLKTSTLEMSELSKKPKDAITDVHDAVREGTFDLLEQAISKAKKNRSLNDLDDIGLSNLHHAVRYNRVIAVASLLKHGAAVNIITREEENSPLHISSRYGWLESTKLLLEHGADSNIQNVSGLTPLHLACRRGNKEVVAALLDTTRIDVNIPDKALMIPLHIAATQGDGELCKMLMDKGADYDAEAADKMTPLLAAVANGNQATADIILSAVVSVSEDFSFITKARDIDSNTILHLAALTNNIGIVKRIVQYEINVNVPTNSFVTPLHIAAGKGHLEMVELLVESGADIGNKSFDGRTALHKAASFGYNDVITFLIDKGAVVDARDYVNKTPFLVAVESGQTESAVLLLSKGANINAYDAMVKNCLHLSIENEHLDTLRVILEESGCRENLNSPDIQERVPLHYAAMCRNIKVLQAILAKQTRFAFQDENQQTPMYLAAQAGRVEHVEALGRAGSPINERDDEGKTALHAAAARGHKKVCLKLLKLGADINYRDNCRSTPLMWASKNGNCKTCEVLLDNGARIDDVNNDGNTALLEATRYNHVAVLEMLLDAGASILLRNNHNMGLIDVAVRWGSTEAAMAICKHPRWKEVLEDTSGPYQHTPMKQLIAHFPDAAKVIMDQCIYPVSQTSTTHPDYAVQYDFYLLDPGPDDPAALKGNRYFGPKTMVNSHRSELLLHPLTQMLLKKKWATIGRFLYSLNFLTYLIFIISYSVFLILERQQVKLTQDSNNSSSQQSASSLYNKSGLSQFFPIWIMAFAVFHMVKELVQMIFQGKLYFSEASNLLEWTLYGTVVTFLIPYVAPTQWVDTHYGSMNNPITMWVFGIISIFLCYVNFVLFLRRLSVFGLYITMHLEVMKTLLRVMLVFSIFLIAFDIVFYILFKEQDEFKSMGVALMKTTIMMVGEIDFSDVFVSTIESTSSTSKANPKNPFPELAFFFLFLFVFIMCIALMNLLVGLAVGDIDKVQREATLQGQAMQVEFVGQLEDKYPRLITRLVYKRSIVERPNKVGRFARIRGFFARSTNTTPSSLINTTDDNNNYKEIKRDLTKTKKRVKTIMDVLEAQNRLLKNLARKIDPSSLEEDLSDLEDVIVPQSSQDDFATPPPDNTEEENVISSL